jgi:RNA-binding protein YhbY
MQPKIDRIKLRKTFTDTKPTLTIGKNGVTVNLIQEALKQLQASEIIKIRVLKSALQQNSFEVIKNTLIEGIGIDLVESRGHNLLLYKASQSHNST